MTISDTMLFLRFTFGWPAVAVSGFVLGVVAMGRLRSMRNGRRGLYRPLTAVAFGLCWTGSWGVLGVWQYGNFVLPLPVPLSVVSTAFSLGVIWIGLSLIALAAIVLAEEFQHSGVGNHG